MSVADRLGAMTWVRSRRLFLNSPSGVVASTDTCPRPAFIPIRGVSPPADWRRSVSLKACVQNCPKHGQFIQPAAHRGFASDVNAAARPNPYFHTEYTGP